MASKHCKSSGGLAHSDKSNTSESIDELWLARDRANENYLAARDKLKSLQRVAIVAHHAMKEAHFAYAKALRPADSTAPRNYATYFPKPEIDRVLTDLNRLETGLLGFLAKQGKILQSAPGEALCLFARMGADVAANLAEQLALLKVAEAMTREPPNRDYSRRPTPPKPKEKMKVDSPLDFSGSLLSILTR